MPYVRNLSPEGLIDAYGTKGVWGNPIPDGLIGGLPSFYGKAFYEWMKENNRDKTIRWSENIESREFELYQLALKFYTTDPIEREKKTLIVEQSTSRLLLGLLESFLS